MQNLLHASRTRAVYSGTRSPRKGRNAMLRIFIALSVLLFLVACDHGTPFEPENDLRVTTDKSEYTMGEDIDWTLANDSDESAWIRTCPGYTIERWEDSNWQTAVEYVPLCIAIVSPPVEIESGTSRTGDLLGQTIDPGLYRVGAEVYETEQSRGFRVVYSKRFVVK